jgi:hypothetical protein
MKRSLRDRLAALESRGAAAHGPTRCLECADRLDGVLVRFRRASPDAAPVPIGDAARLIEPCANCGWQPTATIIEEVLTATRQEVARAQAESARLGIEVLGFD